MVPFMDTVTGSGEKIRETKRPTTVRLPVYELYNIIQRPPHCSQLFLSQV